MLALRSTRGVLIERTPITSINWILNSSRCVRKLDVQESKELGQRKNKTFGTVSQQRRRRQVRMSVFFVFVQEAPSLWLQWQRNAEKLLRVPRIERASENKTAELSLPIGPFVLNVPRIHDPTIHLYMREGFPPTLARPRQQHHSVAQPTPSNPSITLSSAAVDRSPHFDRGWQAGHCNCRRIPFHSTKRAPTLPLLSSRMDDGSLSLVLFVSQNVPASSSSGTRIER